MVYAFYFIHSLSQVGLGPGGEGLPGNKACDLDSAVSSALVFAFYLHNLSQVGVNTQSDFVQT